MVLDTYPNGVQVLPVDKLRSPSIEVALNRVRHCPKDLGGPDSQPAVVLQKMLNALQNHPSGAWPYFQ